MNTHVPPRFPTPWRHEHPPVVDVAVLDEERATVGQRAADAVAAMMGSWRFIISFGVGLASWGAVNLVLATRAWDPHPVILLNLFLSMLAAIQAPVIMMSQNRQAAKDRFDAANDYEVNLKAELEIRTLHEKLDVLRDAQWVELVRMQQEQIALLTRLVERAGSTGDADPSAA